MVGNSFRKWFTHFPETIIFVCIVLQIATAPTTAQKKFKEAKS